MAFDDFWRLLGVFGDAFFGHDVINKLEGSPIREVASDFEGERQIFKLLGVVGLDWNGAILVVLWIKGVVDLELLTGDGDEDITFPVGGEGIAWDGDTILDAVAHDVIAEAFVFLNEVLFGIREFFFKRDFVFTGIEKAVAARRPTTPPKSVAKA